MAVCAIEWDRATARVTKLAREWRDDAVLDAIGDSDRVGIDCPFGWRAEFVAAISAHRRRELGATLVSALGRASVTGPRRRPVEPLAVDETGGEQDDENRSPFPDTAQAGRIEHNRAARGDERTDEDRDGEAIHVPHSRSPKRPSTRATDAPPTVHRVTIQSRGSAPPLRS